MIPFSIMWAGFALFWEFMVLMTDAPFFFKLWGIPFVLVGLYMLIGRFVVDAMQKEPHLLRRNGPEGDHHHRLARQERPVDHAPDAT